MAKALYRTYRPRNFDEVLGQDAVVNVLKNQIKTGKISHAYLFEGERGSGKTTCAKIFAKAVNCLNPKDGSPCNTCENCKSIDEETTLDFVEMDGASNRRIDDIRELRDKVIYPPSKLKYKVYIIDEAHMITREAFNALLKIMEEPPSHLIFILCTTEADKIPSTILSRVQKFNFKRIEHKYILKEIERILNDLDITMDIESKNLIIKNAHGAMRDALSILDKIISTGKNEYTISEIDKLLGTVDFENIYKLYRSINEFNSKEALENLFYLRNLNKSDNEILEQLLIFYRDILIYSNTKNSKFLENYDTESYVKEECKLTDFLRLEYNVKIISDFLSKIEKSDNPKILSELCILKLINYKIENDFENRIERIENYLFNNKSLYENNLPEDKEILKRKNNIEKNKEELKNSNNLNLGKTNLYKEEKKDKEIPTNKILTEENIKEILLKSAGPIVAECVDKNIHILENEVNFSINRDNEFVFEILNEKKESIKNEIFNFTGKEYNIKVKFEEKKEEIENSSKEIEKTSLDKLKDIFGEDIKLK
ncbi:MAG: DNA polymerase III subunit gamma/tau [Peptoniphilaceae bacterium]|nr:DNA polymerase III subunit gamma/tau [Peptoniphilaceae bacterium]MDD7383290.1 DNA polymerase III subunit gamma/tau [Peptoniphilaceae bacterium]MDY3738339.1 DNA polymerase III subunit gamma/tau [Peptoniphilaceae bacterium]